MFPYMNTETVSSQITGSQATIKPVSMTSGQYNLFSAPAVVDVSAIEVSYSAVWAGATVRAPITGAAEIELNLTDGGPTGDATGIADLHTVVNNTPTAQFAINVPVDAAGTALTDIDADDWVNFHSLTGGASGVNKLGVAQVAVAYIYGKPAGIN